MLKLMSAFIVAIPELIKLIKNIQAHIDEVNKKKKKEDLERSLQEDIKKINEAFKNKDINLLNDVFNNSLSKYSRADKDREQNKA